MHTMYRKDISMNTTAQTSQKGAGRAARLRGLARAGAAVAASGTVAGALLLAAAPAFAATASHHATATRSFTFTTLDKQADPTFNQLLGINGHNVIAGYFGSGAT